MNTLTPYKEQQATLKMMSSLFVMPLSYLLLSSFCSYIFAATYWICLLLLITMGLLQIRLLEAEVIRLRSISSSFQLISLILKGSRRQELEKLRNLRGELEKKVTLMVDKYANPEQKILNVEAEKFRSAVNGKKLTRKNSFSESFI